MNDTQLADAVKSGLTEACDSLSTVHMAVPASKIMASVDRARRHRRVGTLAGTAGLAAAAVAVGVALPASHPAASHPAASHPANGTNARLAAWTVTRQADGTIEVSFFRQLRDPAALQAALRADGLPASVTFIGQQNSACQPYPSPQHPGVIRRVLTHGGFTGNPLARVVPPFHIPILIYPAALPSGAGLQIAVMRGIPPGPAGPWPHPKGHNLVTEMSLVKASPQCTGS